MRCFGVATSKKACSLCLAGVLWAKSSSFVEDMSCGCGARLATFWRPSNNQYHLFGAGTVPVIIPHTVPELILATLSDANHYSPESPISLN